MRAPIRYALTLAGALLCAQLPHAFHPGRTTRFSLGPLCAICDHSPHHELHAEGA